MQAETVYLFRHALLRDAAYTLQMPAERARLHNLVLNVLEGLFGGRAPASAPLNFAANYKRTPFESDSIAAELAYHAERAGEIQQQRVYLRRAAEYAEVTYQPLVAAEAWSRLADMVSGAEQVEVLCKVGGSYSDAGSMVLAEKSYTAALSLAAESPELTAYASSLLAGLYWLTGRPEKAREGFERAVETFRQYSVQTQLAHTLCNLSLLLQEQGDLDAAETSAREAKGMFELLKETSGEAAATLDLGVVMWSRGSLEAAEVLYREALELYRKSGDRRGEGTALGNLAVLAQDRGSNAEAEAVYRQVLEIARQTGARRQEGVVTHNLAALQFNSGNSDLAAAGFEVALAIHREVSNLRWEALAVHALGVLAEESGDRKSAKKLLAQAAQLARACNATDVEHLVQTALRERM